VCLPVLARLWRPRHTGKIAHARQPAWRCDDEKALCHVESGCQALEQGLLALAQVVRDLHNRVLELYDRPLDDGRVI
jgi:hypothetical protein